MNVFKKRNPTKFTESLEKTRSSLVGQLGDLFKKSELDTEFWEDLEGTLISADTGLETAEKIVSQLRENAKAKNISTGKECLKELRSELKNIFDLKDEDPLTRAQKPVVFVMVGVNGAGKTTSIAKLTHLLISLNQKVILGAADTFRAAAVDQIQIWGDKLGVTVIAQDPGSDPGAVAFDTIKAAKSRNMDVAIIDTAGRLQGKSNLMEELKKISKIIIRESDESSVKIILTIDGTTGQNGLIQAIEFTKFVSPDGIFLSKLDGTAKGGIAIAIADQLKIPIWFVGTGEQPDDIAVFDPNLFISRIID
ncbi:MAG TPA: signal recognition particle-docking protein FtsY [SAR202 cluster bacterium]|jgi:fused signal recognition particle receptor|nr:signal recognition particle-docking protein FtsY [SAR202 cluster bacterium]|tara:strand:+ start:6179 stop:7102 length:924 start_codon:yes stop_codon:yes gene_type:complete